MGNTVHSSMNSNFMHKDLFDMKCFPVIQKFAKELTIFGSSRRFINL